MLQAQNSVRVSELVGLFGVSVETVRRDLEYMEGQGMLKRVHGGAVLERTDGRQLDYRMRSEAYTAEKTEIAEIAARYVQEGQSILLEASTTNLELARVLKKKVAKLTVLTNSLLIASELSEVENYTVILTGGVVLGSELATEGELAQNDLAGFCMDTLFLSASGISLREGLTDYGFGLIAVKKKMMSIAQEVILLADSSKFDTASLVKVCDLNRLNLIITDSKLNPAVLERYRLEGIEIVNQ
ncbi:MAG TPA: DeoR/GlpR transcriptional regulator [Candidatus Gallacutalibacter stercoravium]|nr:DeoR/GlpR transcriptional regulator [Candidatus Gallacutalibacter stercoravium]